MKKAVKKSNYNGLSSREVVIAHGVRKKYYAPDTGREPIEALVCSRKKLCEGCPYPAHGFICWHSGGQCLRSDAMRIQSKKQEGKDAGNYLQS